MSFYVPFEIVRFNNGNRKIGLSTMCTDYVIEGLNENGVQTQMKVFDILHMSMDQFTSMLFFCQSGNCSCRKNNRNCCYSEEFHRLPLFAIVGQSSYTIQNLFESNIYNPRQQHVFLLDGEADIESLRLRYIISDADVVSSNINMIISLFLIHYDTMTVPDIYEESIPLPMITNGDETPNNELIVSGSGLFNTRYNRVWMIVSLQSSENSVSFFLNIGKTTFNVSADLTVIYAPPPEFQLLSDK